MVTNFSSIISAVEQVLDRDVVKFQNWSFFPRILLREKDLHRICLKNFPENSEGIEKYLDEVCRPYSIVRWEFVEFSNHGSVIIELNEEISI